jgi:hypothetical protein
MFTIVMVFVLIVAHVIGWVTANFPARGRGIFWPDGVRDETFTIWVLSFWLTFGASIACSFFWFTHIFPHSLWGGVILPLLCLAQLVCARQVLRLARKFGCCAKTS